ncbi:MAG TPA: helix-turn-helix domain-containing protein [Kiritimatiellia bacterium]|nr:helix-turn-helix domain-containing protein [Kiritimatiellia bacterium]HMP34658.1 helix-turn-helix domain-containing protein [Kiritimatiellia bacterium]
MSEPKLTDGYLNRIEAAKYLSVSPRTISDLQRRRLIPVVKIAAKCVRYKRSDLDRAMRGLTVEAVGL